LCPNCFKQEKYHFDHDQPEINQLIIINTIIIIIIFIFVFITSHERANEEPDRQFQETNINTNRYPETIIIIID